MRIVVPFVPALLRPAVLDVLPKAELVDVSDSPSAYHELVCQLWRDGKAFLLVEHDVVVNPRALRQALYCHCGWGVSPYAGPGGKVLTTSLGCTRFSTRYISEHPTAAEDAARVENDGLPRMDWRRLDVRLADQLDFPHIHEPVRHLHDYGA